MPDYQQLFERLREVIFDAYMEISKQNYGNAEHILYDAFQKGTALCDVLSKEPAEHSSLAYARRHGL